MKKIYLLGLIASMFMFGCGPDESTTPTTKDGDGDGNGEAITVEEVNHGLYGKLTATWCPPCGTWGWELSKEIKDETSEESIGISIYGDSRSKITNLTAQKWAQDFGVSSWPNFSFNGVNETVFPAAGGINPAQTKTNILAASTAFHASDVKMNVGGTVTYDGYTATVKWATKVFADLTGSYKVGLYLYEDGVMEEQASRTGIVAHSNAFRGTMIDGEHYGVDYSGDLTAGTYTDMEEVVYDLGAEWSTENSTVFAVIWDVSGSTPKFVNASKLK